MSDFGLIRDLRTFAESHEKNGERRTAHMLRLAADRIEKLTARRREHNPPGDELLGDESGPNYD